MDTQTLRNEKWGEVMQLVRDGVETFAVTYRGRPEAVLLSVPTWNEGRERVAADGEVGEYSVREVRANLRAFREAARRGDHALIHRYARYQAEPDAVMAPYEWTRRALPLLGEAIPDDAGQSRYSGSPDHS